MAFHAGLEAGTLEVAEAAAAASGSSLYTVVQPADLRWHVPSAEVGPAASDRLTAWLAGVSRVVALHGYGRPGRDLDVLVGGNDTALAAEVADVLAAAVPDLVFVADAERIPAGLRGRHPGNPVNRAVGGGVQLELPVAARHGAVAGTLAAALAALARTWAS